MVQFIEAQGTGVHIVTNAKTALELGAPIHGILDSSRDSNPLAITPRSPSRPRALTADREVASKYPIPMLDLAYRFC